MEGIVLDSLAFAVRQSPGLYAVLLGSGVSRAAGVPTGWEVMQQLAARVAAQRKEDSGDDPLSWWCRKMGVDPSYSDLLKVLAPTPQARQAILRDFFEPTEDDVDQGRKVPTKAHKEIARLVKGGHIRVILTTNFDRLMENALREEGVEPSILNTPSAVEGALPLAHQRCAVAKLHGDYLDLTMRNTVAELETYPAPYRRLLRRIFDEYGLIVCGWSAEWGIALRKELEKTKQQRFLTYWAQRGEATEAATRLISLRGAQVATIADADSFFEALAGRVEALKEFNLRHPQSTRMAIAELKRYLPEARHRIRLHDQVSKETEAVASQLTINRFHYPPRIQRLRALFNGSRNMIILLIHWWRYSPMVRLWEN